MPVPNRPGGGRGRPSQPGAGNPPRKQPPPRRPPKPRHPPKQNIILPDMRPLPDKPPMLLYVISLSVLTVLIVFGLKGLSGVNFGDDSGSKDKGQVAGPLPNVSIEGASPCKQNDSPRIRLNTEARLKACASAKTYTKQLLVQKHGAREGEKQFGCQDKLWDHESDWSAWAENPSSGAYGIAQILPSTHGTPVSMGDWKGQVDWGMKYIWDRYRSSCNAWEFWQCTSSCARYPGGAVNKLGGRGDPQTTWY